MHSLLTNCLCTVYTKDVHVVTDRENENSFFILVNHDGIKNDVLCRIYERNDVWYIWDPKHSHRQEVDSFTEALLMIEEEIEKCVA